MHLNVKTELWGNWKRIAKKTIGQSCIVILKYKNRLSDEDHGMNKFTIGTNGANLFRKV